MPSPQASDTLAKGDLPSPISSGVAGEFLRFFLPISLVLTVLFFAFELMRMQVQLADIKAREAGHEELARNSIIRDLENLGTDLLILAGSESMVRLLDGSTPAARHALADRYLVFSKDRGIYDQIRYIDETGAEVVRINYNDGAPAIVADDKLQNKGDRYYFKDTFTLPPRGVFVSQLDLNVENKKVEEPYKPMIRLGTPVFDRDGRKRGIVILNYLAEYLLQRYADSMPHDDDENFFLNSDGYWLYSHDREKEWGFMLGHERTFATEHPEAWKRLTSDETGEFEAKDGFYSFTTIYPDTHIQIGDADTPVSGRFWKVGTFLPAQKLSFFNWRQRLPDMIIFALFLSMTAVGSWYLSLARVARSHAEDRLHDRIKTALLLEKIAASANEAPDVANAMQAFIDLVCVYTGWPVGHVYMVDGDEGDLYSTDIWHFDNPERFETFRTVTMNTRLEVGIGLPGHVLSSQKSALIVDVTKDDNFPRAKSATDIGVKSGFAFPVFVGSEIIAVLEFFSRDVAKAAPMLLEVAAQIGTHLGRVVERDQARKVIFKAKEEAEKARSQAETANQSKSRFLSSMSHELRTPLNAIIGFSQLMQHSPKEPLTTAQQEYTDDIVFSGNILLELINGMLDLAKIDAGQLHLSMEDAYADDIITESLILVRPTAEAHAIPIEYRMAGQQPVLVHADTLRLRQVLLNFMSNAVKYNKPGGTVTLDSVETDDGYLRICVTDTGLGIPEELHADIFKPFERLGIEAKKTIEGTGIGLTVTKQLVEMMGGRIGFESEHHKGSTFWVEVPLASRRRELLWDDKLSVGIEQMDDDHKGLIALLNELSETGLATNEVDAILGKLINYTVYHFRREETVMEACGYPHVDAHRKVHRHIAATASQFAEEWRKDESAELIQELLEFLRTWLVDHIMQNDAEIEPFAEGREAEIEQALEKISDTQ